MHDNDAIGTTIPSVWLNGGAHYRRMKGWFTLPLFTLVLRQCLIMGSVSDNCPGVASAHTSADTFSLARLFVSVIPPLCPWVDVMPVVRFSGGTAHRQKLNRPLLCLCCTLRVRHGLIGTREVELTRASGERGQEEEQTRVVPGTQQSS